MSTALARPLLRRQLAPQLRSTAARRFESSTTQKTADAAKSSAEAAKQSAAEYKTKAAEGLSRVTSAAGPAITGAARGLSSALGRVGGRTGRLVAFVERRCFPFFPSPTCPFGRPHLMGKEGEKTGALWVLDAAEADDLV